MPYPTYKMNLRLLKILAFSILTLPACADTIPTVVTKSGPAGLNVISNGPLIVGAGNSLTIASGGTLNLATGSSFNLGSGTLAWSALTGIPSPVITHTGDVTGTVTLPLLASASGALTLATVNSNVGTFGTSTAIPTFTVNAKGLITAATNGSVALVPQTTTVNGHQLTGNVTVTPSDLSLVIGTNVQAYNANLTTWSGITPYAGTLTIVSGKSLIVNNSLTLAGTDTSILNIGTGGTLGTAAFTSTSAYFPATTTTGSGNVVLSNGATLVGPTLGSAVATQISLGSTTPGILAGSNGAITLNAAGTNQSITLTPSGTGTVAVSAGTAALPGLTFGADNITGFYHPTSNVVGVAINGTTLGTFTSTGLNGMAIGNTTPAAGSFTTIAASGTLTGAAASFSTLSASGATSLSSTLGVTGVASLTNTTASSAYTNGALVVSGGAGFANTVNINGGVNSTAVTDSGSAFFYTQGSSNFGAQNGILLGTVAKASSESGGQGTFQIVSNDASSQLQGSISLITSATAASRRLAITSIEQGVSNRFLTLNENGGNVGVGTTAPAYGLEVNGTAGLDGNVTIGGQILAGAASHVFSNTGSGLPQLYFTNTYAGTTAAYLIYQKQHGAGAATVANDAIGSMAWQGYDGSAFQNSASITAAAISVAGGSVPAALNLTASTFQIYTNGNTYGSGSQALTINTSQQATFYANMTVGGTINANIPGASSTNSLNVLQANLTNGNNTEINLGSSISTNNDASIAFVQNATASSLAIQIFGDSVGSDFVINKGGQVVANANISTTSTTTGALIVPNGGVGIGGALNVGGYATISPGETIKGTTAGSSLGLDTAATTIQTNTITSTYNTATSYANLTINAASESIQVAGTTLIGITSSTVNLPVNTPTTSTTTGALVTAGGIGDGGALNTAGYANINGILYAANSSAATSTSSGAIEATGGISTLNNIWAGGTGNFAGNLNAVGTGAILARGSGVNSILTLDTTLTGTQNNTIFSTEGTGASAAGLVFGYTSAYFVSYPNGGTTNPDLTVTYKSVQVGGSGYGILKHR